ncbi:MAG TPA: BatA domain-containing protein [Longimicrobiales bacterium]
MGFLSPLLLLLGLAVAVPLVLHLFQRQQGPRVVFPALRYLRRAEKENARRIKLRQLLLLALRVAMLLLLALGAARPFLRQGGGGHEPTAVAIVLDNSLSTGLVVGERRVLDLLKERALETLERAGPDDRFWLVRAATPWKAAVPGDAASTAARVRETDVASAAADLNAAIARARALVTAGAEGRAAEIHVLTDLQASAFPGAPPAPGTDPPPVFVWAPDADPPPNAAIASVEIGGGLAPRAGERSMIGVQVTGKREQDSVTVRLALDGRMSAAGHTAVPGVAQLALPARSAGFVPGWVELDPDALRGDDRRYFVVHVQPPPVVRVMQRLPFVDEALGVLADAGRIRLAGAARGDASPGETEIVVAPAAIGAEAVRSGRTVIVLPPESPLELPGVNNRLAQAGIPWRYARAETEGEGRFAPVEGGDELLRALEDARIRQFYRLERTVADPATAGDVGAGADSTLLRLRDGSAWAVRGDLAGGGRYVLLASPFSVEASTLPTSAAMLPLLDRILGAWAAAEPARPQASPGEPLVMPSRADAVERPDGVRDSVEGGARYRPPALPGIYRVLEGNRVVDAFAVNPPAVESDLERIERRQLMAALDGWRVRITDDPGDWLRLIYHRRLGREVWRPLLLLALAFMLVEALVAAAGRTRVSRAGGGAAAPARPPRVAAGHAGPATASSVAGNRAHGTS